MGLLAEAAAAFLSLNRSLRASLVSIFFGVSLVPLMGFTRALCWFWLKLNFALRDISIRYIDDDPPDVFIVDPDSEAIFPFKGFVSA